jgi:hypothetical protein
VRMDVREPLRLRIPGPDTVWTAKIWNAGFRQIPAPVSATIRAAVAISREAARVGRSRRQCIAAQASYQSEAGARYYRARPDVITGRRTDHEQNPQYSRNARSGRDVHRRRSR